MLFCLKIFFTFTNSVDSDEMQHYAAFHLGLHCLQSTHFGVSGIQRVNTFRTSPREIPSTLMQLCLDGQLHITYTMERSENSF